MLDHTILDEDKKCMIMLIIDFEYLWQIDKRHGIFDFRNKKKVKEKNLEHLIYLKKKVENYITYIQNGGLTENFPECNNSEKYSYEIRIVTDFSPKPDYLDLIENMNIYIAKQWSNIKITTEKNSIEK